MNNFAKNLKNLRKQRGMNQEELAKRLNVRKTTISNYETGYSEPRTDIMQQIADIFGITLDELVQPALPSLKSPDAESDVDNFVSLPVYGKLFINDFPHYPLHLINFPRALLGSGRFFALQVPDEHMDRAALSPGSIAIVHEQGLFDNGDIVVASVDGGPAFLCRYYIEGDLISLISDSSNPLHRPVIINPKEQDLKLFGKVVKSLQDVL